MSKYKIIEVDSGKDVTKHFYNEYRKTLNQRTDVEMYKAWGNNYTPPSDKETRGILAKNILMEIFDINPLNQNKDEKE